MEQQIAVRTTLVLAPTQTRDQVLGQEFAKGEISGIRLTLQLPEVMVDEATREAQEEANETEE